MYFSLLVFPPADSPKLHLTQSFFCPSSPSRYHSCYRSEARYLPFTFCSQARQPWNRLKSLWFSCYCSQARQPWKSLKSLESSACVRRKVYPILFYIRFLETNSTLFQLLPLPGQFPLEIHNLERPNSPYDTKITTHSKVSQPHNQPQSYTVSSSLSDNLFTHK